MPPQEWSQIWHNAQVDVRLLQASYVQHAFPRHSHDYYVICLIERGRQSFTHQGTKYYTPAGGVILINPGAVHTGEPADAHGFQMRSIYLTAAHMQAAAYELTGRQQDLPFFKVVRSDQRELDEAATIDGANPLQTLLYVIIPQSWPAILAVGLFHFFWAWNDFFEPLVYLQGKESLYPLSVGLTQFANTYTTRPDLLMAASLMTVALPIVVFFLAQRVFMQGIVITGVDK
jgi:AraC-like ligand binding domain/Binding-protein-dependent transport system inner membrane component